MFSTRLLPTCLAFGVVPLVFSTGPRREPPAPSPIAPYESGLGSARHDWEVHVSGDGYYARMRIEREVLVAGVFEEQSGESNQLRLEFPEPFRARAKVVQDDESVLVLGSYLDGTGSLVSTRLERGTTALGAPSWRWAPPFERARSAQLGSAVALAEIPGHPEVVALASPEFGVLLLDRIEGKPIGEPVRVDGASGISLAALADGRGFELLITGPDDEALALLEFKQDLKPAAHLFWDPTKNDWCPGTR